VIFAREGEDNGDKNDDDDDDDDAAATTTRMTSRHEKERAKQIQEKCQNLLTQMLRDEDNKYCVDCDAKGSSVRPHGKKFRLRMRTRMLPPVSRSASGPLERLLFKIDSSISITTQFRDPLQGHCGFLIFAWRAVDALSLSTPTVTVP
jgi:hypothetical protein